MAQTLYLRSLVLEIRPKNIIKIEGALRPEEPILLQGPSGCGKTTLLRALAGLRAFKSGDVTLENRSLKDLSLEARRAGFVFQSPALFAHLSVEENLMFPLRFQEKFAHWSQELRLKRAHEFLERAGLQAVLGRGVDALSGGEKQRLSLLRALIWEPDYLLLDEAFSAIDKEKRLDIQKWILEMLRERPIPTLIVSHDSEDARGLEARPVSWAEDLRI